MSEAAPFTVDLDRAVGALADALDLIGVDEVGHGHRVAWMAATVAARLGWAAAERRELLRAALLHDCGVSSTREHKHLVNELDWEGAQAHCERGAAYLAEVPPLAHLAPVVREHHTHWPDLLHRGVPEAVALPANLIFLADRADTLRARGFAAGQPVVEILVGHGPTHFAPALLDAFGEAAEPEAFWFAQEGCGLGRCLDELVAGGSHVVLDLGAIRALATMFGRIIDAKSPYTERHSLGVARLARWLGAQFGLPPIRLDMLEVAGLLHDLGKLRLPDDILEKPGPLSPAERQLVARHAFDTWQVMTKAFGDGPIVQWAALHHEAMSGHGYPFHRNGDQLPLEARIVAVADVFQALAQDRPYRAAQLPEEILPILDGMVFGGRLDRVVVDAVHADPAAAWREATGAER